MRADALFRVESRGYEDIGVDDNPIHSDFIHYKLAKISPEILTCSAEFAGALADWERIERDGRSLPASH